MGTTFTVFDNGESPKSRTAMPDGQNVRREIVAAAYVSIKSTVRGIVLQSGLVGSE